VKLNGKVVDLPLLKTQAVAAGAITASTDLGTAGDELITWDVDGHTIDVPPAMAPVLAAHVAPPPITNYSHRPPMQGRLRTTNATPTEIYRATLQPMTGYRALATLLGVDAGNGDLRQIYASIVAKRLGAGALLVGSPVVLANHQDAGAAGWAITAAGSGNDFVITVTGATGRTIDWLLDGETISFAPAGA
jgi:hypothetical protein